MIKNRDGTPFTLQKPNPLVATQDKWLKDIVLHNFSFKTIDPFETSTTSIQATQKIEPIKEEQIVPESKKEIIVTEPVVEKPVLENVVLVHCQPVSIKERKDDLYNESFKRIEYGEKFIFEALVIDESDISIHLWTTREIIKGSVIYPSRYNDKRPYETFRWWKITKTEKVENGFVIEGMPSTYQPEFS